MSAKMLLAAVKGLEFNNVDDDTLINFATSLEAIVSSNNFDSDTQGEAYKKLIQIQEVMGIRAADAAEQEQSTTKKKRKVSIRVSHDDKLNVQDCGSGNNEMDELARLMIRSEEDGTLSFEHRGIRWDWNHNKNSWDMTPKE